VKFQADIDIDLADRTQILQHIKHTTAVSKNQGLVRKHATGIYVTEIPRDPFTNLSTIDFREAEERGYIKLDLLNIHVYKYVRDEQHLNELMREPDWTLIRNKTFFEKIIHIGNHYESMMAMPEPIDSIPRMAMFLAAIRPGKKHLIGKPWQEVAKTIWEKNPDEGYSFKRSHSFAHSHLVVVHINLLEAGLIQSLDDGDSIHA
jgi:hypothetical protein